MGKPKKLFEKEMKKKIFKKNYWKDRELFKLELQFLKALEESGLTYEQFAKLIGSSKGNIARDLKSYGLGHASVHRIEKMAKALGMEFVPLLLPKDKAKREEKLHELLRLAS
ncbi:MAG: helix-turn-helix domain-containing protein [Deltaproteobacteria bacterium]|nr:helix-turn-helix domain-containing protein [Deltaproteobacteria bacterium]